MGNWELVGQKEEENKVGLRVKKWIKSSWYELVTNYQE